VTEYDGPRPDPEDGEIVGLWRAHVDSDGKDRRIFDVFRGLLAQNRLTPRRIDLLTRDLDLHETSAFLLDIEYATSRRTILVTHADGSSFPIGIEIFAIPLIGHAEDVPRLARSTTDLAGLAQALNACGYAGPEDRISIAPKAYRAIDLMKFVPCLLHDIGCIAERRFSSNDGDPMAALGIQGVCDSFPDPGPHPGPAECQSIAPEPWFFVGLRVWGREGDADPDSGPHGNDGLSLQVKENIHGLSTRLAALAHGWMQSVGGIGREYGVSLAAPVPWIRLRNALCHATLRQGIAAGLMLEGLDPDRRENQPCELVILAEGRACRIAALRHGRFITEIMLPAFLVGHGNLDVLEEFAAQYHLRFESDLERFPKPRHAS